ncbi:MAG: DUF2236 domain-containing protein [Actinobacteria bacterium]|nr:DUF2236 domain-containing protein [Actinomycetota bacterium]MCB8997785.1 DUF2236 domain-containing protein [Actinomycetota bacterium]MCB9424065.1 DUF2236 domain-containing protein [Actinomycetota bacterium]HRY09066.1 oxygenase MpaB family protein [Candidatus Nanopelagicales bacterium]
MGVEVALTPIAGQVREILSGRTDGASEVARAIARPPGAPGWFAPGDAIWTVHGSVATFLGGIRSLLLQALHPLALAGVDRHSGYREDPFGRLQRTGAFIAATTYGSASLAEQTIRAIQSMHSRVRGTAPDGRTYSAQDPRLLLWVHIALTNSMLRAYLDFGRDGRIDADSYVADMAVIARAMGVPEPPTTVAQLTDAFNDFRPELRVDADTRRTQRFILDAPLPLTLKPGYRVLARAAWDSLPPWALTMLDSTPRMAGLDRALADASLRVLRVALVASPARLAGEQRLASA